MQQKTKLATENTENTEYTERDRKPSELFSVISVPSDMTTSRSTKLPNNASQVAGYVAKRF